MWCWDVKLMKFRQIEYNFTEILFNSTPFF